MSKTTFVPDILKSELRQIAASRKFPLVERVLERGGPEELILANETEAQAVVNVARLQMLEALLRYPFWDDESPEYDQAHEDAFQDVQMGIFEKTVYYVEQAFSVTGKV